ncbi:MFS transporter [Pseudofrankia sp. BMG5.37]|uniref:MFS transporter n=1 Tax=Pseudofrankia sp. BMG5.36 TaxID=1834512 RepID=UPI000A7E478A|nr:MULTISPECIES: MFS transporter [unclassified Pseudofrankia]MDT3442951.1 MFS transporter [Pseudofrankia sp. BMG5.37]
MERERLRLALLAVTQLIVALDYNIVYVALPDIGDALDFSPRSVQWVVSAYAVGLGGLLLFGGRAVDRLGPRRMFMTGLALSASRRWRVAWLLVPRHSSPPARFRGRVGLC